MASGSSCCVPGCVASAPPATPAAARPQPEAWSTGTAAVRKLRGHVRPSSGSRGLGRSVGQGEGQALALTWFLRYAPWAVKQGQAYCLPSTAVEGLWRRWKEGTGHAQGKEHPLPSLFASKGSPGKHGGSVAQKSERHGRPGHRREVSLVSIPPLQQIPCAALGKLLNL